MTLIISDETITTHKRTYDTCSKSKHSKFNISIHGMTLYKEIIWIHMMNFDKRSQQISVSIKRFQAHCL
jgi:hypothetical protein